MNVCPPETIGGKFLKKLHKHFMADKVQKFLYFVLQKFLDTVLQKFLGIRDEFNLCPPETIGGKFLKKLHKHLMADKDDDENPMFTHKFCIRKVFRIKSKNV